MRSFAVLIFAALTLTPSAHAMTKQPAPEMRTVFHYAERAWAVGTIRLSGSLTFRDGKVLVFPAAVTELLWAPKNTKPRNMMLVYEVPSSEMNAPFFKAGDEFFAPIRLLAEHSYWRDNLPNTPRHEVFGGRRSVFRGADLAEARRIIGAYLAAGEIHSVERWKAAIAAVASALVSPASVLREDAVRYLAGYSTLARDFDDRALPPLVAYFDGSAPDDEKAALIEVLSAGGVMAAKPTIQKLSAREDAIGAAALRGLSRLGDNFDDNSVVIARSRSASPEVRAWAAGLLGKRAGRSGESMARAVELLDSAAEPIPVREAAANGLAESADSRAVAVLTRAVDRGDDASQPAGEALAAAGATTAVPALIETLEKKEGPAALGAALALGHMKGCGPCGEALRKQHEAHKDLSVRNLIGVVIEAPLVHKH